MGPDRLCQIECPNWGRIPVGCQYSQSNSNVARLVKCADFNGIIGKPGNV